MIDPGARPRRVAGLYEGVVRRRRFVHDPRGFSALAVLSSDAARIFDACDGRTVGELASALDLTPAVLDRELSVLARNGFVRGDGVPEPTKPAAAPRTFDAWVHVTNTCNLDCPYCYIDKGPGALDDASEGRIIATILERARAAGARRARVRFAGGEPMIRFDVMQRFWNHASDSLAREAISLAGAVLTNGTLLPDGAAEWFAERGIAVSISIDGVGAAHDRARPSRREGFGAFAAIERNLERYLRAGIRPYVLTTITWNNLDELPALARWCIARGLGFRWSLSRDLRSGEAWLGGDGGLGHHGLIPLRRGESRTPPPMLVGDALARCRTALANAYDAVEAAMPIRPSFRRTHQFCDLSLNRPIRRACGAGESSLAFTETGESSPCQAAFGDEQRATLDLSRSAPAGPCESCRHRFSCAGGCPLLLHRRDGHARGQSPYCELFRYVIPRILRISALELLLPSSAGTSHRAAAAAS